MPDTRASNPTSSGPSLLDKSTAKPGSVDMAIFEKNQAQGGSATTGGSQKSQGAVNSKYLEECRRDNPAPSDENSAKRTVTLSDCRIDTPQEDLATDQPFKMSCVATSWDGKPVTSGVTFRLYCTLPDGTEEDTGLAKVGKREDDRICAEGTLYSPKKLVEWGEMLKFHVLAEHVDASEIIKSDVDEVMSYAPIMPNAIWILTNDFFEDGTTYILPRAKEKFIELHQLLQQFENPYILILGMVEGKCVDLSHSLESNRARALGCMLSQDTSSLIDFYRIDELLNLEWDSRYEMLQHTKLNNNAPLPSLIQAYINSIALDFIPPERIIARRAHDETTAVKRLHLSSHLHEINNTEFGTASQTAILIFRSSTNNAPLQYPCRACPNSLMQPWLHSKVTTKPCYLPRLASQDKSST